jgi:hypothetical protein
VADANRDNRDSLSWFVSRFRPGCPGRIPVGNRTDGSHGDGNEGADDKGLLAEQAQSLAGDLLSFGMKGAHRGTGFGGLHGVGDKGQGGNKHPEVKAVHHVRWVRHVASLGASKRPRFGFTIYRTNVLHQRDGGAKPGVIISVRGGVREKAAQRRKGVGHVGRSAWCVRRSVD